MQRFCHSILCQSIKENTLSASITVFHWSIHCGNAHWTFRSKVCTVFTSPCLDMWTDRVAGNLGIMGSSTSLHTHTPFFQIRIFKILPLLFSSACKAMCWPLVNARPASLWSPARWGNLPLKSLPHHLCLLSSLLFTQHASSFYWVSPRTAYPAKILETRRYLVRAQLLLQVRREGYGETKNMKEQKLIPNSHLRVARNSTLKYREYIQFEYQKNSEFFFLM